MIDYEIPYCNYDFKKGWWCSRHIHHNGPCALRPRWWNMSIDAWRFRKAY